MTLDDNEKEAVTTAINACHNLNVAINALYRLGFSVKLMESPFDTRAIGDLYPRACNSLSIHKIVKRADYQ